MNNFLHKIEFARIIVRSHTAPDFIIFEINYNLSFIQCWTISYARGNRHRKISYLRFIKNNNNNNNEKWYNHKQDPVINHMGYANTDREIKGKKQICITITFKKQSKCLLIEFAILSDCSISQKETEKHLQY